MNAQERIKAFRSYLGSQGLKLTTQRDAIAKVLFSSEGEHLSLPELLERAQKIRSGIGYATVYRTMRLLVEGGFASEHQFGDGQTRYEPADETKHHDHLICVRCGKVVEFEDPVIEARQDAIAAQNGFEVVAHRLEIYVRCLQGCEDKDKPA